MGVYGRKKETASSGAGDGPQNGREIGGELVNAVITAAVWSEGQKPGIWQKMIEALNRGGAKTEEGTVNDFLFRAMVDRLLEEFHAPGDAPAK